MATFYLDYEGGNDANDGLSFANRWKTFTNGATAARIAPGDTIRVMASPDPTSIGNATWTGTGRPASKVIVSSTNASPIVITTSAAHGLVAGDYVAVANHVTNTNANGVWKVGNVGSSTTFEILQIDGTNTTGNGVGSGSGGNVTNVTNCIVKLASPITQNVALCGGLGQKPAWTASTNVTATQNASAFKEGYSSGSIAIAAGFTTGKAAYYTLPATLDLSGYQQLSFWVQQTAGTIGAAGAVYLALCSDTAGATVVNQINLPALGILNNWQQIVVDTGAALGASIRSVALYVVTDNGAQTFLLDNIVACKAASATDSLTLASLISKNTGSESWYPIQSINYDAVMLANSNALTATNAALRGYYGSTATTTTYKREAIKTVIATTSAAIVNAFNDSGTSGSLITYSGGWNRTDMSTQTGETWFDGQNGGGYCFTPSGAAISYIKTDKLNCVRYNNGWRFSGTSDFFNEIGDGKFIGCTIGTANQSQASFTGDLFANNNGTGVLVGGTGTYIANIVNSANCETHGVSLNNGYGSRLGNLLESSNCATSGLFFGSGPRNRVQYLKAEGNGFAIVLGVGYDNTVSGGSSAGNLSGCVSIPNTGNVYLNDFTINDTNEFVFTTLGAQVLSYCFANNLDDTFQNSWVFSGYGTCNQQSSIVDSPATTSWKMNPVSTSLTDKVPLRLKLGTVVCAANSLVTVTARMRRDDTGLTMRLVCPGGQIAGVTTDAYTDMTAAAGAWETVTLTFTPTRAGGVDIYAYAFGGTTYSGYVCNLTASQA